MKKLFALILTTLLVTTMAVSAFASEAGACKGIVPKVEAGSVVIDGTKDAAYDNALCVDINQFLSGADLGTYGKAYMLWTDGSYMAIFTRPLSMSFRPSTVCIRAWWAAHSFSILGSTARPSAVSTTPPRLRLRSVMPSSLSSDVMA